MVQLIPIPTSFDAVPDCLAHLRGNNGFIPVWFLSQKRELAQEFMFNQDTKYSIGIPFPEQTVACKDKLSMDSCKDGKYLD